MADKKEEYVNLSGSYESKSNHTILLIIVALIIFVTFALSFLVLNGSKEEIQGEIEKGNENINEDNSGEPYIDVSVFNKDPYVFYMPGSEKDISLCNNYQDILPRASCKIASSFSLESVKFCKSGLSREERKAIFTYSSNITQDAFNVTAVDFCYIVFSRGEDNYCNEVNENRAKDLCNYRRRS